MKVQDKQQTNIVVGIDWADKLHAFFLMAPDGEVVAGEFQQQPEAIDAWLAEIRKRFPQRQIAIVLEQARGALITALLKYEDLLLYPINPGQLAKYRKSMCYGGSKSDPADAELLAQFLFHYQDRLRPLQQDSPETRKLAMLAEHRRGMVEQRTDLANQLTALLKQYFPLLIEFRAAKPYAKFLCRLLLKWPTLKKLQRAKASTIVTFFHKLNMRGARVYERTEMIAKAVPLTHDQVLIECCSRQAQYLAKTLLLLTDAINEYDSLIEDTLKIHEDRSIFASFPNAAKLTQARMIAAFGTDRKRFEDAQAIQACSGIAPVTRQSGKSRFVNHRWACPKFMKQTFHEYAGLSIKCSVWAKAYYRMQLARGKKPNMAKRALAYKWQRILYRCWKDRIPYDEAKYLKRLQQTRSPILDYIAA